MIPAQTDLGRSFKGAAAYYLHDKRQAGEAERLTGERVAWSETVNLATADPERGWRMMAHTALAQAELKEAAGVKATGRKLTKPVFAYSLSWHPDEKPSRADQMKAARETLTALGLDGHQAVVVAHNDEPHAHVHVLVNRVHPETGVAATLGNSKLKLSQWALDYTKARGTDHLTPAREKNHERRQRREPVSAGRKPRAAFEADRATSNDNLSRAFVKEEERRKDAQLYEAGRQMFTAHGQQWAALNRTYGTVRGRVQASTAYQRDRKAAEIKEKAKPRWRNLFQVQKVEQETFEAAERGTLSKLWSMAFAFQHYRRQQPQANAMMIFVVLASSAGRRAVFMEAQEIERRALAGQIKKEIAAAHKKVDAGKVADLARLRAEFVQQSEQLRQAQQQQRDALTAARNVRKAERQQVQAPLRKRVAPGRIEQLEGQGRAQAQERSIRDDDRYRRPRQDGPKLG